MKKNKVQYFIKSSLSLFLLLSIGCKKEPEHWQDKYILYKDTLCKTPIDTILLFEKDSNYVKKDGYYRMYGAYTDDYYATGKIKNHKKVGLWKSYFDNALDIEENYNDKGELDGFVINYNRSNGKFISVYHFVNGEQEGIQKEYHLNNVLARVYTLHRSYNYRGEYVCYDEKGKILYKENFGKEGTGYYKEFSDDTIFREGAILKDRYVGMYIEKNYYLSGGSTTKQIFHNSKGGMYMVKIFGNLNEVYETKEDSMVYYYLKNKTKRTTFLKGKIIKNEQFNDTLLSL